MNSSYSPALPTDYAAWLAQLKTRVAAARQRAALATNVMRFERRP